MTEDNAAVRRYTLEGLTLAKLTGDCGGRLHVVLDGRFVTVVAHKNSIFAFDSACYHSGGPLGEGAVADIEDIPCIRCPWHNFLVALDTGEEVTRITRPPDFDSEGVFRPPQYPLQPLPEDQFVGPPKRGKKVQRTHKTELDGATGDVVVCVDDDDLKRTHLPSDINACHPTRGAMCMQIRDIKNRGLE